MAWSPAPPRPGRDTEDASLPRGISPAHSCSLDGFGNLGQAVAPNPTPCLMMGFRRAIPEDKPPETALAWSQARLRQWPPRLASPAVPRVHRGRWPQLASLLVSPPFLAWPASGRPVRRRPDHVAVSAAFSQARRLPPSVTLERPVHPMPPTTSPFSMQPASDWRSRRSRPRSRPRRPRPDTAATPQNRKKNRPCHADLAMQALPLDPFVSPPPLTALSSCHVWAGPAKQLAVAFHTLCEPGPPSCPRSSRARVPTRAPYFRVRPLTTTG